MAKPKENVRHLHPVDSWHSIFVLVAAITGSLCTTGLASATSVFYLPMVESYGHEQMGKVTLVTNLPHIVHTLCAPFGSLLYRSIGSGPAIALGGIITTIGYLCSWLAPSQGGLEWLVITMGLVGIGMGCSVCAVFAVQVEYFSQYAHAACAAVSIGSAMGGVIFPRLIYACIEMYGWRGAYLISAGITLNLLPCAIMLKNNVIHEKSSNQNGPKRQRRVKCSDFADAKIARKPLFISNTLVAVLWFMAMMTYATFINALMVKRGDMTKGTAATIMSLTYIGNVSGRALAILVAALTAKHYRHHSHEEANKMNPGNHTTSDKNQHRQYEEHGWMPNCGLAVGQVLMGTSFIILALCQHVWSFCEFARRLTEHRNTTTK